jgi:hypothetical protein
MSSRTRGTASTNLGTENIHHRLALYSAAALTAGVGMLAMAQPAEGSVVVTKTNLQITLGGQVAIDLNKDGVNDLMLFDEGANYDHSFYRTLAAIPLNGGKVVGGNRGPLGPYASALTKGANIGPSAHFSSSQARGQLTVERALGSESASVFITYYGKFQPGSGAHYLGIKFLINGQTHYGWLQLTVNTDGALGTTVTEYAYETVANKKIGAGATSDISTAATGMPAATNGPALGMLARGADALALWRRDQNQLPHP